MTAGASNPAVAAGDAVAVLTVEQLPIGDLPLTRRDANRRLHLMFEALAPNSQRALLQDLRTAGRWCQAQGVPFLPMPTLALEGFLRDQALKGKRKRITRADGSVDVVYVPKARATLARYLVSIHRIHARLELPCPTQDPSWPDIWKAIARNVALAKPQKQAAGITWALLEAALAAMPDTTLSRRDAAIVSVLYDGMLRESELCALRRSDLLPTADGGASARIPKSKTDQIGKGAWARINPDTMRRIRAWLERSPGDNGPLFVAAPRAWRRLPLRMRENASAPVDVATPNLRAADVDAIVRRVISHAGIDPAAYSGHSGRVGQCRDLFANDFGLPAIMEEGRWTSQAMPVRYASGMERERGAAARLAQKLGRK